MRAQICHNSNERFHAAPWTCSSRSSPQRLPEMHGVSRSSPEKNPEITSPLPLPSLRRMTSPSMTRNWPLHGHAMTPTTTASWVTVIVPLPTCLVGALRASFAREKLFCGRAKNDLPVFVLVRARRRRERTSRCSVAGAFQRPARSWPCRVGLYDLEGHGVWGH